MQLSLAGLSEGEAPSIQKDGGQWAAAGSTEAFLPSAEACFLSPSYLWPALKPVHLSSRGVICVEEVCGDRFSSSSSLAASTHPFQMTSNPYLFHRGDCFPTSSFVVGITTTCSPGLGRKCFLSQLARSSV